MLKRFAIDVGGPVILLLCAYGVLQAAIHTTDKLERDLALLLIGSLVTFAINLAFAAITRSEGYRQGAYTERAKVVTELLARARDIKQQVVDSWATSIEPATVPLRNLAFHNRVWVGDPGVRAVHKYNTTMIDLGRRTFKTRHEAEVAVNPPFKELENRLTIPLGFRVT